jgi:cob(I)alamin adenosyltransferase
MSIATKTGDDGSTALMYGRRVPKNHPRVEAYGAVDELNAALGVARAASGSEFVRTHLRAIQRELIGLMGELATLPEDRERYQRDGHACLSPEATRYLDTLIRDIEAQHVAFKGWATPGETREAAALDVARTVCRRAERRVCALDRAGELPNAEILVYLNRLSDALWLLARWVEAAPASSA